MTVEPGTVIAQRYRVVRQLGKGGMGEVFSAENTRTGRMVAVKVLRAEAKTKASAIERFRREARASGSINSDYVTEVLDVEDDPQHGIVLVFELLQGESLVERLKRTGPLAFDELWDIVESVWMGLADAHAAGVIHRDLKPSNVFLQEGKVGPGRVKILDFGISKLPKKITTHSLTQVGQSLGTFSFMPPEQIGKAKTVDHRADIYACTTLIYQALSGKLPYQAANVVTMMELKTKSEPRSLSAAMHVMVDPRLEAFIAKGLARNPDDRFQTALEALDAWRELRPVSRPEPAERTSAPPAPDPDVEVPSSEAATLLLKKDRLGITAPQAVMDAYSAAIAGAAQSHSVSDQYYQPYQSNQYPVAAAAAAPAAASSPSASAGAEAHGRVAAGPAYVGAEAESWGVGAGGTLLQPVFADQLAPRPGSSVPAPEPQPQLPPQAPAGQGRTWLLLLGAFGLMLVSFAVVALLLHFLR